MVRESTLKRNTKETSVNIYVNLDGEGLCDIDTEIGFFNHMLELLTRAFSFNAGITLHIEVLYGENDHHKIEAIFKGVGRALKVAKSITTSKLQSTKGII